MRKALVAERSKNRFPKITLHQNLTKKAPKIFIPLCTIDTARIASRERQSARCALHLSRNNYRCPKESQEDIGGTYVLTRCAIAAFRESAIPAQKRSVSHPNAKIPQTMLQTDECQTWHMGYLHNGSKIIKHNRILQLPIRKSLRCLLASLEALVAILFRDVCGAFRLRRGARLKK